jgi:hypothetical protein
VIPTYGDCDANVDTGCETSTNSSVTNCGACGHQCSNVNNTPACSNGDCHLACSVAFLNCDGDASNGCEVNRLSDSLNCGTCGHACGTGEFCASGECAASCALPLLPCDGVCVDPRVDPGNCDTCGHLCPAPLNGQAACGARACGSYCNAGFADCDGGPLNGCEVTLASDPSNCNGCGVVCTAPANAIPTCTDGGCGFACAANFADCDGIGANGCEVDLRTDAANCGSCGSVCGVCSAGECASDPDCDDSWGVLYNNRCYYLDGSGGACDAGYVLGTNAAAGSFIPGSRFAGKTYRHTVSISCCIYTSDAGYMYRGSPCNDPGGFQGTGITTPGCGGHAASSHQLTLCSRPVVF